MPNYTIGRAPAYITVHVQPGYAFAATMKWQDGREWDHAPVLRFADGTEWAATIAGDSASWTKTGTQTAGIALRSEVQLLHDGSLWATGTVRATSGGTPGGNQMIVSPGGSQIMLSPAVAGASAYDIWLAQGNTGSEDDFLESLIGPPGSGEGGGSYDDGPITARVSTLESGKADKTDPRMTDARTPTAHTHAKSDVGLGNVDNTSDADKPISSATQTALNGKAASNDPRLSDARQPLAHTHTASQITDATTVGKDVLTASSMTAARSAIGAGTSSLQLGTGPTTAKAGDWKPDWTDVQSRPTVTPVLVLGPSDPVPGGTAAGTVIVRKTA